MKHLLFFALKDDLVPVFELVEAKGSLKYARTGNFLAREFQGGAFDSGTKIPNLGIADADSSIACEDYLVCKPETPINIRRLQGVSGERVCVDQLVNPDSITICPGGTWRDEAIIAGRIDVVSEVVYRSRRQGHVEAVFVDEKDKVMAKAVATQVVIPIGDGG